MINESKVKELISKYSKRGKTNWQLVLDAVIKTLPRESWEDIVTDTAEKRAQFTDGNKWKTARWFIRLFVQKEVCAVCGKSLGERFQLHHHNWKGNFDYYQFDLGRLQAIHLHCHEKEHAIAAKNVFNKVYKTMNKKERNKMPKENSLQTYVVNLVKRDKKFKNLFDSKFITNYSAFSEDEDSSMHKWCADQLASKGISFDDVANPVSQMRKVRCRLKDLGFKCATGDGDDRKYVKFEYTEPGQPRESDESTSQVDPIIDRFVTSIEERVFKKIEDSIVTKIMKRLGE